MSDLTLGILGFPAANRDLTVELRDPVSQTVVREVKPFLDGTARVPNIEPGLYEMTVRHPNVVLPVLQRPIRVLPVGDTKVSLLLDPSKFRNTPIEDIPEANLGPINDAAKSIAETITPLAAKKPGEAILAQDWNAMGSAVRDLANTLGQMVQLVSPTGHNHPELENKINEMSDNFQQLLQTLSSSLAELQRQIQADQLQSHVKDVLDQAGIDPASARGKEFLDLVDDIKTHITDTPSGYGRTVRNTGVQLETKLEQLLDEKKNDPQFATSAPVLKLTTAVDLAKEQRTTSYGAELDHQRKTQRILGNAGIAAKLNQ
jgi:hypothetical protein